MGSASVVYGQDRACGHAHNFFLKLYLKILEIVVKKVFVVVALMFENGDDWLNLRSCMN